MKHRGRLASEKVRDMRELTSFPVIAFLSAFMLVFTGCELIGDIFQAGMWVGIILVVLVIGLVMWLVRKARG